MKRTKRILAVLICAVMILALMPAEVSFARIDSNYYWYYTIYVKTQNVTNAKTKNTVKVKMKYVDESGVTQEAEIWSRNGMSGNTEYTNTLTKYKTTVAPWQVTRLGIECGTSDAVCIDYLKVYAQMGNVLGANTIELLATDSNAGIHDWIGGKQGNSNSHPTSIYEFVSSSVTYGQFIDNYNGDNLASSLKGSTTIDPLSESGTINVYWNGYVNDQYVKIANSGYIFTYKIFNYAMAPTVTVSASAVGAKTSGTAYKTTSINDLKDKVGLTTYDPDADNPNARRAGFTIDREKLRQYMNANDINKLEITTTLKFPNKRLRTSKISGEGITTYSNGVVTVSRTFTIIRRVFALEEITFSSNYSEPAVKDNYYYNNKDSNSRKVTVKLQVARDAIRSKQLNQNHFTTSDNSAVDFTVSYRYLKYDKMTLQVGGDDGKTVVKTNGQILLSSDGSASVTFTLASGDDSGDAGLAVILEGAKLSVQVGRYDSKDFYLYRPGTTSIKSNNTTTDSKTVSLIQDATTNVYELSNPGYHRTYNAAYKVDMVNPEVTVSETDGGGEFKSWTNKMTVGVSLSESIYTLGSSTFNRPEFTYSLRKEGTTQSVNILQNGSGTTGSTSWTSLANVGSIKEVTLALATKDEGKYELVIEGKDKANNEVKKVVSGLWLDNKPPEISMTKEAAEVTNGVLSQKYIFDATDLSESARTYYYIATDTKYLLTPPTLNVNNATSSEEISGTADDFNDRWIFIPQTDNDTSTTDGAYVITLEQGESFTAMMYYAGVDGSGNMSTMQRVPIVLQNTDLTCTVGYDIIGNRNDYDITLNTKSGTATTYRWLDSDENEVAASTDYTGSFGGAWGEGEAWDGAYILEYTVTSTSLGTTQTGQETFIFDNKAPEIEIEDENEESYDAIHVINVDVNDTFAISEVTGQYYTASGEEIGEEFSLIDAEANGVYSLSETLLFGADDEVTSGAYILKITATDENGNSSESTSGVINVRNAAPEVTLSATANAEYGEDDEGTVIPLVKEGGEYKVKVNMSEAFVNPELAPFEMAEQQVVYYRVTDGSSSSTSTWSMLGVMSASEATSEFAGAFEIANPAELVEGRNIVTMEFIVAAQGRSIYENEDQLEIGEDVNRIAHASFEIYCDKTAPMYSLTLEDGRTSGNITGKLVLLDEYSPDFTWETSDDAVTLTLVERTVYEEEEPSEETAEAETEASGEAEENETEATEEETGEAVDEGSEGGEEYSSYTTYTVTVSENTSSILTVTDKAGNSVEIPIVITGIDREGPSAVMDSYDIVQSGDRYDAYAWITVSDMASDSFQLAIIPSSKLRSAVTDGVIADEYFSDYADTITYTKDYEYKSGSGDEVTAEYYVYLAGVDGEYYIGVRAEDELGNSKDTVFEEPFEIVDVETTVEVTKIVPKVAGTRAKVTIESSVPIYILPQNMITDTPWSGGEDEDEDYDIETTNMLLAAEYATSFSTENTMIITDVGTYTLYVCDDLGRMSVEEIVISDEDVSFGNGLEEPTVTTYVNKTRSGYDEGGNYVERAEVKEEVAEGEYAPSYNSYTELGDYDGLYRADEFYSSKVELVAADGTYLQPNDDEVVENGLYWNESESEISTHGYTKMVYDVEWLYNSETWEEYETAAREIPIYICTDERYEVEDWYSTSVFVDNIDNTEPVMSMNYDPVGDTLGDVVIDVYMSDPDSGMSHIYLYDRDRGVDYTIWLKDENGDMIDYATTPYTFESDLLDIELYSDTDPRTDKHLRITAHENVDFGFVPYNGAGMGTYDNDGILRVESINKIPLSDEHYTLTYYGSDAYGNWQVVDPEDDETYFRVGKVVIEPTSAGNERGLYVVNNGGSGERELNILGPSYTFELKDQYGHELSVETMLTNFDMSGGELTYELETEELTNSATVTITAYDAQSGVDNVTMAVGGTVGELVAVSEEDGLYTYQETLTKSGTYTITLTDKVGNVTQEIFMVSTIDSEAPEIAGIFYTKTTLTDRPVVATLTYTKKNVTLKTVEPAYDGFDEFEVDYANSMIRFLESGTVDVSFADAYGNVGYGSVSVSNIYTIPPSLEAVMTVADDKQSVTVTFDKALDENLRPIDTMRELEDITVKYGGIARRAQWPDDEGNPVKAEFTFIENGTYVFDIYDDAWITTHLSIAITGIDTEAPQITQVSWSYNYDVLDENGNFVEMRLEEGQWVPQSEAGYMIFTDAHPITNYDVDVTVETDSETKITGKTDSVSSTTHTVTYDDNGSYMFNVEKDNGMLDSYGFEVGVIDKTPPVIELDATEILFYENTNMGVSYNRDLIDKGFTAYDIFRDEKKDLTSRVKIDYGNFDPNDITNNKYDRTIPYTITYSVTDDANNTTEARLTVRLVGLTDTIVLVNGKLPDSTNRAYVSTPEVTITLQNFSGVAYAKVEPYAQTMGYMKTNGTVIEQSRDAEGVTTGEFTFTVSETNWYTVLVQTDKRDYFNLQIAVELPAS